VDFELREGLRLGGRYRLLSPLGEGAMAAVWKARNEGTEREFALKLMHPESALDPMAVQRFLQEARAAGCLRHRGIVEVYDVERVASPPDDVPSWLNGSPYLVMELLDGESLEQRLLRSQGGRLPAKELVAIVADAARALSCAHAAGIVHRDVKAANVFLHRDGDGHVVKVLDFGVSKLLDPMLDASLTRTGTIVGSPAVMSPEQARGERDIDARTDVWALGVLLYRGLSGRYPFEGTNRNAVLRAILADEPQPLDASDPEGTRPLAELVGRCLSKTRDGRPATAAALAEELERFLEARIAQPTTELPAASVRDRRMFGVVAAILVGVTAALALALIHREPTAVSPPVSSPASASGVAEDRPPTPSVPVASASVPPLPGVMVQKPVPGPGVATKPSAKKLPDRPRDPGF
jgi:serine/threonine protein kinase